MSFLTVTDWIIFIFIACLPHIVLFIWKKRTHLPKTNLEYLLMGRKLTLPFFVTSLVATWYGGIIGVSQLSFEMGLYNFLTQGIFWYIVYLCFAFFLVKKLRNKFTAYSLPDLVEQIFGPKSRKVAAVLNYLHLLPIAYLISMGIMLQWLFGGSLWVMNLISISVVVLYLYKGGFKTLIVSDFVQCIIMLSAITIFFIFAFYQFGDANYLKDNLPANHLKWTGDAKFSELFIWALIASSTLIDPNFYQRVYAAKDEATARNGILWATFIWILFDLMVTFTALFARAAHPEFQSSQAYLLFAMEILPVGVKGFFLAGIVATIISTLDSFLFTSAVCLSYDYKNSDKISHHQYSLIFTALVTFVIALFFEDRIVETWRILGGLSASLLVVPVLSGIFFPGRIRDNEFCLVVLAGVVSICMIQLSKIVFPNELDSLMYGLYSTSFLCVYFVIARRHIAR
jgi:SSS family solute:Na+ symporter